MGQVLDIPWRDVRPMPDQPREYFGKAALQELASSIAAVGQLVPAMVCPLKGGDHRYELIDGQRRWHAVQMCGLPTLRAEVVDEPDPEKRFLMSVVANFGREENHPMEQARAFARMRKTMSSIAIAAVVGRSDSHVCKYLRLLDLHPDLAECLHPQVPRENRLPVTVALHLASLPRARQMDAYRAIRASPATPMTAAAAVLGRPQVPRTRRNMDGWEAARDLRRSLDGTLKALAGFDGPRLRNVLASRGDGDREKMRWRLGEVAKRCATLIDSIGEEGPCAGS